MKIIVGIKETSWNKHFQNVAYRNKYMGKVVVTVVAGDPCRGMDTGTVPDLYSVNQGPTMPQNKQ